MLSRLWNSRSAVTLAGAAAGVLLLGGIAFGAVRASLDAPREAREPVDGTALAEGRGNLLKEALDKLVQSGVISADQRDKILKAVEDEAASRRGPGIPRGPRVNLIEDAARIIGISVDQLRQELPGKSLGQVAQNHGVTADTLKQKLVQAASDRIDQDVADKRLTADQAAKLKPRLADVIGKLVDRTPNGRPKAFGRFGARPLQNLFADVAKAIGITAAELRQELPGKSFAQVAQAHNVTTDALVSSLVTAESARIDDAVAKGTLTQDRATRIESQLKDMLTKAVNRTFRQKR